MRGRPERSHNQWLEVAGVEVSRGGFPAEGERGRTACFSAEEDGRCSEFYTTTEAPSLDVDERRGEVNNHTRDYALWETIISESEEFPESWRDRDRHVYFNIYENQHITLYVDRHAGSDFTLYVSSSDDNNYQNSKVDTLTHDDDVADCHKYFHRTPTHTAAHYVWPAATSWSCACQSLATVISEDCDRSFQ